MKVSQPRQVYPLWKEADKLGVLDKAVVRAIEHQDDHDDSGTSTTPAFQSMLTTQQNVTTTNTFF